MAKKRRRRQDRERPVASTSDYRDSEGNVLTLRDSVSAGTVAKLQEPVGGPAASMDDAWRRRTEMLFERLAVSWEIAGLPLTDQAMLIGRYRMADEATRAWVRRTIAAHVERHIAELADGPPEPVS
jgi:hypothetical protein